MSPLILMLLDYALHLDLIWRCKDTNYFSFHQTFLQLFSYFLKHLTFPPVPFNISPCNSVMTSTPFILCYLFKLFLCGLSRHDFTISACALACCHVTGLMGCPKSRSASLSQSLCFWLVVSIVNCFFISISLISSLICCKVTSLNPFLFISLNIFLIFSFNVSNKEDSQLELWRFRGLLCLIRQAIRLIFGINHLRAKVFALFADFYQKQYRYS